MKTIKFFTVLAISLLLTPCNGQDKTNTTSLDKSISKIEVLDCLVLKYGYRLKLILR